MNKETKLIDPDRLISPTEYAKLIGRKVPTVTKQMNLGQVEVIKYRGGRLIYLPEKEK